MMKADAVEDLGGVMVHFIGGRVVKPEGSEIAGDGDFVGGEIRIHFDGAGGLDEAEAFAKFVEIDLAEGLAEDLDVAGGGPEVAGDNAGERAFAAAIRTEHGGAGSFGDLPGEVVENPTVVAAKADAAEVDGKSGHGGGLLTGEAGRPMGPMGWPTRNRVGPNGRLAALGHHLFPADNVNVQFDGQWNRIAKPTITCRDARNGGNIGSLWPERWRASSGVRRTVCRN